MPVLPIEIMPLLVAFAPVFSSRVWRQVPVLVVGAILTPGARQVSRVLRVMGLGDEAQFQRYHRVLNRAVWSSLAVSRILLGLLLVTFAPAGPVVLGIDETIERRRGKRIRAKGTFRDPVRSRAFGGAGGSRARQAQSHSKGHDRAAQVRGAWLRGRGAYRSPRQEPCGPTRTDPGSEPQGAIKAQNRPLEPCK